MTETGILNRDIAAELARMGHTDRLLIADAGLTIPDSTRVIDLSLAENVPTAVDVLHLSCPARWSAIPTFGTN